MKTKKMGDLVNSKVLQQQLNRL